MSKEKSVEIMLEEFLESMQDRNNRELTEDKKNKLKKILVSNFAFVSKDKAEFLKIFNPWQNEDGQELIQKFVDNVNNLKSTDNFSWLDILNGDREWNDFKKRNPKWNKLENKNKHLNMQYQIPTHFHGDIDNAEVFHCLENPRGYLGDWKDAEVDKEIQGSSLKDFYEETALKRKETGKTIVEIIRERYQLKKTDILDSVTNIIYSEESSLLQELNRLFDSEDLSDREYKNTELKEKRYYYIPEYYSQLIQKNKKLDFAKSKESELKDIAKKICNLEIYPFSCAQPNLGRNGIGEEILSNSNLSRLGAYIILRRIYRYLANGETKKPVFIFRKYDGAWKKLFDILFKEVEKTENPFVTDKFLKDLENHFFYCQLRPEGGGITSGNVISVSDFYIWRDIYTKMKKDAFTEISSLLTDSNE